MKCDQCEALMINGVFCHETGCPNSGKKWDMFEERWVSVRYCSDCDSELLDGERCTCGDGPDLNAEGQEERNERLSNLLD